METPAPFNAIIEETMARDAEYFKAHPGEREFERDFVPGECWPVVPPPGTQRVVVRLLGDGLRARMFVRPG